MKSYILHKDWSLTVSQFIKKGILSHEESGMLLEAIFDYQLKGEINKNLSNTVSLVFLPLVDQFRRDEEKYNEKVERNKKNGIKGGRPPKIESEPVAIAKVAKVAKAPKPPKEPCLFEDFYTLYPRKEAKQNALKAYQKAVKQVSHEAIIEGVSKYKQQIEAKQTEKQYIKQPATWLNQGCWEDDYGSTTTTTSSTNAYDALLAKIKSVMDQDGNFEHNASPCNIHNIEKFISAEDSIVKVYYTDTRGITDFKNFTIEKITKIGAYC